MRNFILAIPLIGAVLALVLWDGLQARSLPQPADDFEPSLYNDGAESRQKRSYDSYGGDSAEPSEDPAAENRRRRQRWSHYTSLSDLSGADLQYLWSHGSTDGYHL